MFLHALYLHHFRNYSEAHFTFGPQFNLICGSNAQGKTNVLEALHYLMMGNSFRSNYSQELIQAGTQAFYLELVFSKHGIDQSIKMSFDGKLRQILYNQTTLPGVSSLLGIIPGVVITPDDVNLVKGTPQLRRHFLDLHISQTDPLYVHHLTRYVRAMRQRNQLLKAKQMITIDSWEHEMSQSAAYLTFQRNQTVQHLQKHCQLLYHTITNESELLEIEYKAHASDPTNLSSIRNYYLEAFKKHRGREMLLGYTLAGPHKDDLIFKIDGKEVRHFASEGQQRSYVSAIRLAEWQQLHQKSNQTPILMVDDIGLSLDAHRRQKLLDHLTTLGQVFLTTTDEKLLQHINSPQKTFLIKKGSIQSFNDK